MEANKRRLHEIIGGSVQFVIPVFQRDYSWTEDQCEQLWTDLERVANDSGKEHFFGPIVYINTYGSGAAFNRWLLIDGQQRLTTVTLLMAALRDHYSNTDSPSTKSQKIEQYYLSNTQEDEINQRKLLLRDRDDETLSWRISSLDEPDQKSKSDNIEKNYQFFRSKFREGVGLDFIENSIGQLAIVDVRLDKGKDDPQQIFESLNSTGIDLSQADLVRNYVLMGLDETAQTNLYKQFWKPIERLYSGNSGELDNFLREFCALQQQSQKQGRIDQVYNSFRLVFGSQRDDLNQLKELLEKMLNYARCHAAFVMKTEEFPTLTTSLERVRSCATTPAILVVRLLSAYEKQYLSESEAVAALHLLESYLVRRDVCGLQTRSYWQQFAKLSYSLNNDDVLGSLQAGFHHLKDTNYSFPTDQEFRRALEEEKLYHRRICRTLLERLENGTSKEKTDTSTCTIEHIMPQNENLHEDWKEMLGQGQWQDVHEIWLHRLGNLTLTGYNSEISDLPFDKKKTVKNGFNDSSLKLNRCVAKQEKWTAEEMRARGKRLAENTVKIWNSLKVSDASLLRAKRKSLYQESEDIEQTKSCMDEITRSLFDKLRNKIYELDSDVIEVAKPKSVSYHHKESVGLICEVIPRTERVLVLFDIECGECVTCNLNVRDVKEYKFIQHSQRDSRSFVNLNSPDDLSGIEPLIQQALVLALD